ncbi:hypothetical protein PIROE2DRAFT_64053 [Piromyces sp. E2]|nr:hypothetical protein PIROE2DRAFT_64053 [Piromyces sp. E2]|eukprot:OUM59001.1 hypothetical protein PIROE2DRAFT_64053 [Piromyces sp. E2]
MDKNNIQLGSWEKIRVLYLAFPKNLREQIHPDGNESVEDFLKESINKINFQIYLHSNIDFDRNTKNNDDFMDLDNIETNGKYKHTSKPNNVPSPIPNYCYICRIFGHSTEKCTYNTYKKSNKNNIDNKGNDKSKSNKVFKRKRNTKNKNKSVDNIEYVNSQELLKEDNENTSDDEISFDEIQAMYNINMDSFETIEEEKDTKPTDDKEIESDGKNSTKEEMIESIISLVEDSSSNKITWTFDTGASEHITNNKEILTNFKEKEITLKCANGSTCNFDGIGTYEGSINGYNIILDNVLYSKDVNKNLLSGIKLAKNGMKCNFKSRKNKVYLSLKTKNSNKRIVNIGTFKANKNNTIRITTENKIKPETCIDIISDEDLLEINDQSKMLWHRRLGHYYQENLNKYLKLHNVKPTKCLECKIAKLNRKPHNRDTPKAKFPLEVIHSDVVGPISKSFTGKRYILTFIDEFTRKSWIFLLENKSEIPRIIINFLTYLNNQFNNHVKIF